jgi:hypothetical protein
MDGSIGTGGVGTWMYRGIMAARCSAKLKSPPALSVISKCHTKLLETTVTCTKQTKAIVSKCHKTDVRVRWTRIMGLPRRCSKVSALIGTPKRLEIDVTPRKHSSPPVSNRDKNRSPVRSAIGLHATGPTPWRKNRANRPESLKRHLQGTRPCQTPAHRALVARPLSIRASSATRSQS